MSIAASILPEFDQEIATTRTLLERVPEAQSDWRPHHKSYSMGELAMHLATLPTWVGATLEQHELELGPGAYTPDSFASTHTMLGVFDSNSREAREVIAGAPDSEFMVPWTFKDNGRAIFTLPRAAVLRSFVMNHIIHHRGQLSVYLRMNDVPLPPIYGPTADSVR